jgi:hypothetical protein
MIFFSYLHQNCLQGHIYWHLHHRPLPINTQKEAGSLGQGNGNGSKGYIGKG